MPLRTKRIYDTPDADDGFRLLIMRLWPRGIRKDLVDTWDRGLAPSRILLTDLRSGAIDWGAYVQRFTAEMSERDDSIEALAALRERVARETVTLLCSCRDETHCHRTLLAAMVEEE